MIDQKKSNETKSPHFSFKPIRDLLKLSIVRNSGIYIAGNFLQKTIIFLLIPVYTYYLSPSDYGITGLATTIEGVLVILFSFGIRASIARFYYDFTEDHERLKQYISASFLFLVAGALLLTLAMQIFGNAIWQKLTSGQIPFSPYIVMVLWSAYAMIIINFVTTLYQTQQNANAFVVAQISTVILNIAFTILFIVVFNYGAKGQLFGRLISTVVMAVVLSWLLLRDGFSFNIRIDDIRSSLVYGFPLIFHGLFSWAVGAIDRIMLEPHIPLTELGFYNLGCQIGGILTAVLVSINLAWVPYYYSIMKEDIATARKKIIAVTNIYVILVGFVSLIGILFSKEILLLISSPRYQSASIYVPIILIAAQFNGYYFMASTPIFYQKKTMWIPIITGATALLNVGLNLLWIRPYGAIGSAWATFISYVALAVISYFLGQKLQPIRLPLGRICLLNLIIAIGVYFTTYPLFDQNWGYALKLIIIAMYVFFVYFGFIKSDIIF